MTRARLYPALAAVSLGLLMPACTASSPVEPAAAPGPCRPDAASALAGQPKPADDEARRLTGATVVRQIRPGQPVTMDYSPARVTIETDPRSGRVLRAACG
ncbi:I78 family peptidase inhibitor [Chelatococcus composti]|jgi:hypothetical protein|uniref:Peptidase inhibitor I78 family protein n=1 Tax=Chelatococcus composti TaxID=1743235 RepID=A0A841K7N1_9HYPH|nr:I78 family peptidase inhibitor [Chelatococcus composti]MBB6168315.1 hypothetical protein [Chelatococcus composti]GGG39109.1 hypothetical protein GCM10008026_20010 [Chelatococcus composti]